MGLRDRFSNFLFKQAEKRGLFEDIFNHTVRYGGGYAGDDNILESSDVYELLQDTSNQMMLAEIVVGDKDGKEIKNDSALKVLKKPNNYLTQSEFIKLMTNTYLLQGEVFPVLDGDQLHLASNVYTELDDRLIKHFKVNGEEIPSFIEKQELESTPGLLEDLFIHVKETIQIQNMNQRITKAPVKTEADGIDKDALFMEAYVELINHKFLIFELAAELSSVLKELNCFVQSSLPLLQSELDSQEPQSAFL
ncbi:hypothetical protein CN434_05080 [Bacillus thuringiensis]|nr:hypothetical protein CN434_05080 [Bacillus thuringiensis]PGO92202.1 hypothetical protein CN990_02680 [Bacillus thuringiensis]